MTTETTPTKPKARRGFAAMNPERRREIARSPGLTPSPRAFRDPTEPRGADRLKEDDPAYAGTDIV